MISSSSKKFYWSDMKTGYGWVSIILHWVVATIIIILWSIGDWMQGIPEGESNPLIGLHISIAASTWILIWARIVWRLKSAHPHLVGQSNIAHTTAKWLHYTLLGAIALMLISGPVMVWSGGWPIEIFGWVSIPSPIGGIVWLNKAAASVHDFCADVIIVTVLLHICGAFKHLMFNDDETFIRMLVPPKRKEGLIDIAPVDEGNAKES